MINVRVRKQNRVHFLRIEGDFPVLGDGFPAVALEQPAVEENFETHGLE